MASPAIDLVISPEIDFSKVDKMKAKWIVIAVLVLVPDFYDAWRPYTIRYNSFECKYNGAFLNFLNCSHIKLRQMDALNINIGVSKNLIRPQFDLIIMADRVNQEAYTIVNFTNVELCQFFEGKGLFTLLDIARQALAKSSNLPNRCPIKAGTDIVVRNFAMDAESLPPYLPDVMLRTTLTVKEKTEDVLNFYILGGAVYKKSVKKLGRS